ncbi:MAG TPA: DUF2851 family protein, partial [Bacteroidales bacterium]|nr:DUF2851 family protein [Bacteroidales bacterium]
MNEEFLHFIWRYKLFNLPLSDKETRLEVEVLSTGIPNPDAGPDFTDVRIRTANTIWAGNAEIHRRASDWNRHGHQTDPQYNNVILHLVEIKDTEVKNSLGQEVPTMELTWNKALTNRYLALLNNHDKIGCRDFLNAVDPIVFTHWMNRMIVERLEQRTEAVFHLLNETAGDWQEVYYRRLLMSLGMNINAQPFEMLSRSLPYSVLRKHTGNLLQTEALLLGQAGFLEERLFPEEYFLTLRNEYAFLKAKYSLKPVDRSLWKFMRMRPGSFPTLRLAQFAKLMQNRMTEFDVLRQAVSPDDFVSWFHTTASEFWDTHYHFDRLSEPFKKSLGKIAATLLVINAVVPVLFA